MKCWVCGRDSFTPAGGMDNLILQPDSFEITDAHYGMSLPRFRCENCGFIQCNTTDVTSYYEQLEDSDYIESSSQRTLQFEKLLKTVEPYIKNGGTILDIGAGSGIFIHEATKYGYSATGIEPSAYLAGKAQDAGLNVIQGTFPESCPCEKYDTIFLTDVIEHIVDPMPMLKRMPEYLKSDGKVVVTTSDVSSVLAKVMGNRWWHYRVAHIGYYNKKTLGQIMEHAGMTSVKWKYAKWYFSSRYIMQRLAQYFPFIKPITRIAPKNLIIPLNLYDSWIGVFEVKKGIYENEI